jgi:hypothetical protein
MPHITSEYEKRLLSSTDAKDWASAFILAFAGKRVVKDEIDMETLIGWFANAIETGRTAGEKAAKNAEG